MSKSLNTLLMEYLKDSNLSDELVLKTISTHVDTARILNLFHYEFRDINYLLEAITHSSFLNEFSLLDKHNEKLEFLGDSVLNILISNVIFHLYPQAKEGELSRLRSALVCEESLIKLAYFLGLDKVLLLGKGELHTLKDSESMLADCFEAVLGAIFLDGGFPAVQFSFDQMMKNYLELEGEQFIHFDNLLEFDAKSILQERTMKEFKALPEYVYEQLENRKFKISIYVNKVFLADIESPSKKKGAKLLAKKVLQENLLEGVENGA